MARPLNYGIGYPPHSNYAGIPDDPDSKVRVPPNTEWEDTPKWMFWKPVKRRIAVKASKGCYGRCCGREFYDYQHPAFVAREILEERFGQQT